MRCNIFVVNFKHNHIFEQNSSLTLCGCLSLHYWGSALHLNFCGRLQNVSVLGYHQYGNEVDNSQRKELSLFRFLLVTENKNKFNVYFSLKFKFNKIDTHNISVNDSSQSINVHVLKQFLWVLNRTCRAG